MRRYLIKTGLLLLTLVTTIAGHSQTDPHFSQYYAYPMWLNPGLTGAIDGNYRVTAMYRSQWGGVSNPFATPGVSADLVTNKNVSFGVNIMNQRAGNIGYNYLTGYGSMSYNGVRFGYHQISIGMALGLLNRKFDPSKFRTGDQWLGATGWDPNNASPETLSKTSAIAFDAGVGAVYYDGTPGKKANLFGGISAYHLTQPQDPFFADKGEKMPMRLTVHGGLKYNVSEDLSITPNLLYMRQGTSSEKMVGAYAQMRVNESTDFLVGANYRFKDAFAPYVGVYYKNYMISASYDVNASDLGKVAGNANNFEISLTLIGRKSVKQDAVPFVCPRL
ncbi:MULTISPECIES: PorP/SprF family type IX secretion system membrane protein [Niastella]|uniref:PorP/SprF family type IX secretion system membrane protein n=1 Tax=Niastella soli TaxID=2821487 RepID=A0ABS3YUL3_9BACT|nr:PorP/SprF family type IX secretion system membrane protein [Niastella soli]MBO9201222.1 PorP/SprF family type IX secretion system membrane protein [Niastella soli]